jgi:O-antigen/teichoic acid export membrane protein
MTGTSDASTVSARVKLARIYEANARFLRAVFVYGLGQIALKGFDLVVFAILVRGLTRAEFGFVAAVTLFGYVITEILSLGLFRVAVPRFVLDTPEVREKVLSSALGAFLIYAAIIGAGIIAIPSAWIAAAGLGGNDLALKIFAVSFVLRAFVVMELEVLRMDHRAGLQAVLEAVPSALNLLAISLLLPAFGNPVQAAALASVVSQALPFVVFFAIAIRRRRPSLSHLPDLLRFSGPTVIHRTLGDINGMASRWIVLLSAGVTAAGVFTFLIRIGDLLRLSQAPMIKAWTPAVLTAERDGDAGPARRATMALLAVSTLLFVIFLPLAPWIAAMIDHQGKYGEAHNAITIVLFAGWLLVFQYVYGVGFLVAKRPGRIAPITAVAAATNVVASFVLLKLYGILLVPYAAVISNAVFALLSTIYGRAYFTLGSRRLTWVSLGCLATGCAAFVLARILP